MGDERLSIQLFLSLKIRLILRFFKFSLNFGPANAEIVIMRSNMQYVIFILIIFALQMVFYTGFRQFEDGIQAEQLTLKKLNRQNEMLQLELVRLSSNSNRAPASISISKTQVQENLDSIDMSEFYFLKALELYKSNQTDLAITYLDKIKANSLVQDNISMAAYYKIEFSCRKKLNDACLSEIDFLITQYPEAVWTAKSIQFLSHYYKKNQRSSDAEILNKIVSTNFSKKSQQSSGANRL